MKHIKAPDRVDHDSTPSFRGSRLLLDMKPYLDKLRFRPLADPAVWNSAMTNGIFVRFDNVELSHDEILSMAERAH